MLVRKAQSAIADSQQPVDGGSMPTARGTLTKYDEYREMVARLVESKPDRALFSWAWQEIAQTAQHLARSDVAAVFIAGVGPTLYLQCSVGLTDHDQMLLYDNPPTTDTALFLSASKTAAVSYLSDRDSANPLVGHILTDMDTKPGKEAALRIVRQDKTIGILYLSWTEPASLKAPLDKHKEHELSLLAAAAAIVWTLTTGIEHELDAVVDESGHLSESATAKQGAASLRNALASRWLLVFRASPSTGVAHCTVINPDGSTDKAPKFDASATRDSPNTIVKSILSGKALMLNKVSRDVLARQTPPIVWSLLLAKGQCWCGVPVRMGTNSHVSGALLLCDPYAAAGRTVTANVADLQLLSLVANKVGQAWSLDRAVKLADAQEALGRELLEAEGAARASEILLSNVLKLFPARVGCVLAAASGAPEILACHPQGVTSLRPTLELSSTPSIYTGIPRHLDSDNLLGAASELYASQGFGDARSPTIALLLLSPLVDAYSRGDCWYLQRALSLMIHTLGRLHAEDELRDREVQLNKLQTQLDDEQRLHALRVTSLGKIHHFRTYARTALKCVEDIREISRYIQKEKSAYRFDNTLQQLKNTLRQIQDLANNLSYRVSPPRFEPVNLYRLLLDMGSRTQWLNQDGRPIQPQIKVSSELPNAMMDASSVSRAISNMVKNSAEAGATEIVLEGCVVKARSPDGKEGAWLRVSVVDNGRGIPQEIRNSIFDFGFSTKRMASGAQGSGIGLADALEVVKNIHGGWIELAEGRPHRQTVFYLYLPLQDIPKGRE